MARPDESELAGKAYGINDDTIETPIYQLYEQAIDQLWNPRELDFSQDKADWEALDEEERTKLLRITASFLAGEQRVAEEIAPLIYGANRLGKFHWIPHLSMFLMEEVKHAEFFSQWHKEVVGTLDEEKLFKYAQHKTTDPSGRFDPEVVGVTALPQSMRDLLRATLNGDREAVERAYVRAATIYCVHQEGISGQPSYRVATDSLQQWGDIMPGLQQGFDYVLRDEGRHVIGGTRTIRELLDETPAYADIIYDFFEEYPENVVDLVGFQNSNPDLDLYQYKELQARMYRKRFDELGLEIDEDLYEQILDPDITFETEFLTEEASI